MTAKSVQVWKAERLASLMEVSLEDAAMVLEGAKLMRETQTEELIEKYRFGLRTASGQKRTSQDCPASARSAASANASKTHFEAS